MENRFPNKKPVSVIRIKDIRKAAGVPSRYRIVNDMLFASPNFTPGIPIKTGKRDSI